MNNTNTKQTTAYTENELETIFKTLKICNQLGIDRLEIAKVFLHYSHISLIKLIDKEGRPPNHYFHLEDMAKCLTLFGYDVEDVETKEYMQSIEEEHAMYTRLNR